MNDNANINAIAGGKRYVTSEINQPVTMYEKNAIRSKYRYENMMYLLVIKVSVKLLVCDCLCDIMLDEGGLGNSACNPILGT